MYAFIASSRHASLAVQQSNPFQRKCSTFSHPCACISVCFLHQIERYNALLVLVRRSCVELVKGIKGLVVMSADLDEVRGEHSCSHTAALDGFAGLVQSVCCVQHNDPALVARCFLAPPLTDPLTPLPHTPPTTPMPLQVFEALFAGKVPAAWLKAYPSLKGLAPWTIELLARIEQLARWAEGSYPRTYWLGGFTYPTGFLTAVLQVRVCVGRACDSSRAFEVCRVGGGSGCQGALGLSCGVHWPDFSAVRDVWSPCVPVAAAAADDCASQRHPH